VSAVRVLCGCSLGGEGHLAPLVNIGRAVQRAGHEPMMLVPPALAHSAQRAGLPYRAGSEPPQAFVEQIWDRVRAGPADAVAGLIDRELFADRCTAAMLASARELRDGWRPELVVREPCEYASAVAAHEAGIAQAQIGISLAALEWCVREMVAPIIDRFSPGVAAAIGSAPYLSSFPPSLDPSPWPDTRRFRLPRAPSDELSENADRGWGSIADRPLIYMTFGSVLGHLPEARGVYRCALAAVAGLPLRVLLTVGRATDPAALGPIPDNTHVERWVAQDAVLREAALVVCHGGSGTTVGALAAGVPLVICPLFADQPENGRVVQEAGAGVVLGDQPQARGGLADLGSEQVARLRERIEAVLTEPGYRQAAVRIAGEMAGLPSLDVLVGQLLSGGRLAAADVRIEGSSGPDVA
jgi:UDP:flavonoid glycosyltransferase YjiC (YdhE family)